MTLGTKPDFQDIHKKWATYWEKHGTYSFDASSKKEVYSIDSPPPFTSGALHMGHVLSYAFFDFAARYRRMNGYNVLYAQGWDCQGFPTEVKVEKMHGKEKLSRAEFKKKCVEFTFENIEKMKGQMIRLGFSPDWTREYRTIDPSYHKKVQLSILQMYEKELVYRKKHPVQYCTQCQSAIAKAETDDVQRDTKLNYLNFTVSGKPFLIATTRPEMLHACVAVLVNPSDSRFKEFIGKKATVPLYGKEVPVIADGDVDPAFGTGVVMVCTFGDKTDVTWMYRHSLPLIEAFDEKGLLINAGEFTGVHLQKARDKILEKLAAEKILTRQETTSQSVKVHDRCGKPAEFLSSTQWFMKLTGKQDGIKKTAVEEMKWYPQFAVQYLLDWADFIEYDWVISRQRIYGTPLPFWHCDKCTKVYVPKESELPVDPALHEYSKKHCECGGTIVGEKAVADCWVDSSITPLIIAGWPEKGWEKLYPSTLRPQGLEIIRTWAFYTIYRCLALTGKAPFKDVLINGSVLGTDGKKMSKSVGNFEDPETLLARFPADSLRQWASLSGAMAKDRPFSYKDIEYASSFLNKLWNAAKFVELANADYAPPKVPGESPLVFRVSDKWILANLNKTIKTVTIAMEQYDYYAAVNAIHSFFWHSFCDYYLEDVKYRIYENTGDKSTAQFCLSEVMRCTLKLIAPFAPFISEELFHELGFAKQEKVGSIHVSNWPVVSDVQLDDTSEKLAAVLHEIVSQSRKYRGSKQIGFNQFIETAEIGLPEELLCSFADIEVDLAKIARIKTLHVSKKTGLFV
ncbi:MAG: valine--tRNA ligase, partial [Candidatus Micrarchaeota archaeon]|nr:valine--tRNA ligase [Candidatus Micrarchaeota archaeon]